MAELAQEDNGATVDVRTRSDPTGATIVTVAGELDMSNTGALEATLASVTAGETERVVFDLSALRFIDSAGLAVLLNTAKRVGTVQLRDPSAAVRRVVELTGLTTVLAIEP